MQTAATYSPAQLPLAARPLAITREELTTNSTDYLLWGTAISTAAVVQAAAPQLHGLPFSVAIAGVGITVFGFHFLRGMRRPALSGQGEALRLLRVGMWVLLAVLLTLVPKLGWAAVLPLMLFALGMRAFVAGGILQRRPLIFGGAAAWIFGGLALHYPLPLVQLGLLAATAGVALLLPGLTLRRAARA